MPIRFAINCLRPVIVDIFPPMRLPFLPLLLFVLFNLLIDGYIFSALRHRCKIQMPAKAYLWGSIFLYLVISVLVVLPYRTGSNSLLLGVMWALFAYISIYVSKYLFVIFDLIARIPELFRRNRLKWLSVAGGVVAIVTFATMWWGALINRYRINDVEQEVRVANLPQSFDGYRIVQLSDLHVGSFGNDTTFVSRLVDHVNSLNPDLIVFTGDIVNRKTDELTPFLKPLSRLKARDGVKSILGNHDYGDYTTWPSQEAKKENLARLIGMQKDMGWDLLLNSTSFIHRDSTDSVAIIGVENIGDPPFHVYGSLDRAYRTLADDVCKILLSHNPAHWVNDINGRNSINIPLTLSGHTHAMQVELFGLSPAAFRYPTWGGLYSDSDSTHQLYVNIGEGTVGMPARIGATPEVTVITMKKK